MSRVENAVIANVESIIRKTKFGEKPLYFLYLTSGEKFQWGWKRPTVAAGQTVTFEFKTTKWGDEVVDGTVIPGGDGGATLVTTSGPSGTTAAPTASVPYAQPPQKKFPVDLRHSDRSIIRQNSLARSMDLHELAVKVGTLSSEDCATIVSLRNSIMTHAAEFEKFSAGDYERDLEEKMKADRAASVAADRAAAAAAAAQTVAEGIESTLDENAASGDAPPPWARS